MQSKLKTIQGTWNAAPEAVTLSMRIIIRGTCRSRSTRICSARRGTISSWATFRDQFPVAGLRIGYDALVAAMSRILGGFPAAARDRFFWQNAKAFYRL